MKIGVLLCGYGDGSLLDQCLSPWLESRKSLDIEIAVTNCPFTDFEPQDNSALSQKLRDNCDRCRFDLFQSETPLSEFEARNGALKPLLEKGIDLIWLADLDEIYEVEQIYRALDYVEKNDLITWFGIHFKNYIFDGKRWIDGFCPPRIFRVNHGNLKLNRLYYDNDFVYVRETKEICYKTLANVQIPRRLAHVKHLTWLHTNGRQKYEYQMKHFGHCSYKWNYETNQLEFDKNFHVQHGIPLPRVFVD